MNDTSIFTDVALYCQMDPDYISDQFRAHILDDINTQLNILHQIGLDFDENFYVEDESQMWSEIIGQDPKLNMVKKFVKIGTKLEFDPPTNSFLFEALKNEYTELTSRINYQVENSGRTL